MKRLVLILLCILFTSCYNIYTVTTPEMMDRHIEQTNQTIIDNGYRLETCEFDTIRERIYHEKIYMQDNVYCKQYEFTKPDGTNLQYNVKYRTDITTDEVYIIYVDTVTVIPTNVPDDMMNVVQNVSNPPREKFRKLNDRSVLGITIGVPFGSLAAFLTWAAIINRNH